MIRQLDNLFVLETESTSYVFCILDSGHLEHLYYGKKVTIHTAEDAELFFAVRAFLPGNSASYSAEHPTLSMEKLCQEVSSLGKGDYGTPFVDVIHADGSRTSDFRFEKAVIDHGAPDGEGPDGTTCRNGHDGTPCDDGLPHSWAGDAGELPERLTVTLRDTEQKMRLEIAWYVYADCEVITRTAKLVNESADDVRLQGLMSGQLDIPARGTADRGMIFTTFTGSWGREMQRNDQPVISGRYVNESVLGASSSRANPFCMLRAADSTENYGDVYGFNLIYSGNHRETVEFGIERIRFMTGIHPLGFEWLLKSGESFCAPEAVMSYSSAGMNGLSQNMHEFVREHIVRGPWQKKPRPVLLNSWEACYMEINERKILHLARAAREAGIELMVMDDGWFGKRENDTCSLGDWTPDRGKLPGGIEGLCNKVNALGLDFGIWVEPEMVNVDSDLFRAHPDWALEIPGHPHSEGRTQRVLDLTRPEVVDHLIGAMSDVFGSGNIKYVKWDMNRNFTDVFSSALPAEQQGEVAHRYMLGLYRLMKSLTEKFPQILFEGCASGGNRTDLGILCYFQQVWGSDNTDALCRAEIQNGYSYGYPLSVIGAHVSSVPNHQTLRETPLSSRYAVASFGLLGYELNLAEMTAEDRKAIAKQVAFYKKWRDVYFSGRFYRGRRFAGTLGGFGTGGGGAAFGSVGAEDAPGDTMEWTVVSRDQSRAVGFIMQKLSLPNMPEQYYLPKGLDPSCKYQFTNVHEKHNIKAFGSLVNTVSPVHIKQDSIAHELVSRFVKLDGEEENITAYGDAMMASGVTLHPAFAGTGFDENVRLFRDFYARLYFMERVEE